MDYQKIYTALIERAKTRVLSCYTETHHILPWCMNGSDAPENKVELTPEEHYIAHQLLVQIHPTNDKLVFAAKIMASTRCNNKLYGWLKRKFAAAVVKRHTGRKNSPETIAKMRASAKARGKVIRKPHSLETIAKMRAAKLGKKLSVETIAKISTSHIGIGKGKKQSAEWIQKRTVGRKPRRTNLQIQQGLLSRKSG